MDVSPTEIGRYGMHKAKMGSDRALIGPPIRWALLSPGQPGVETFCFRRYSAVGVFSWRNSKADQVVRSHSEMHKTLNIC